MSSFWDTLNINNIEYLGDSSGLSELTALPSSWLNMQGWAPQNGLSDRPLLPSTFRSSFYADILSEWDLPLTIQHPVTPISLEVGIYDISVETEPVADPMLPAAVAPIFNPFYGYGVVDAAAAVAFAVSYGIPFADVPNIGGVIWGLDRINAPEVWAQGYTGQDVIVAVIDTGVDYTHPDLDDNIWTNPGEIYDGIDNDGNGFVDDVLGWDFVNWDNNPMDDTGHGTHVAGTIAAENNGFGITGVAYNAKIMSIKVLGSNGGTYNDVAAGIFYAVNNGARVINLSLGGAFSSRIVTAAVRYATENGVVVVMASGNEGRSQPSFPANLASNWGIAVGAVDSSNRLARFSNRAGVNPLDFVIAPGVRIWSTTPNATYSAYSGTSMATPHVAGVAALMLSANPFLTSGEVETILVQTANPSGIVV